MVTQGHWKWYHSKAWVRFIRLLQQLWLYLVPFWRKSEILVENRDLFIRLALVALVRGVPVGILHNSFVRKKTTMVWLADGEKTLMICLAVSTEYRHVTDKWTDGQTSCHGIVCAMHTHRAVKTWLTAVEIASVIAENWRGLKLYVSVKHDDWLSECCWKLSIYVTLRPTVAMAHSSCSNHYEYPEKSYSA